MKELLLTLFDYNYWANGRILGQAAHLTEDQLQAPSAFSMGSLHATLLHTLGAEWIWRQRTQLGQSPARLLSAAELATLTAVRARWAEEEQAMRTFLQGLTENQLQQEAAYSNTSGLPLSNQLGHILHHLVLHGMQHRAEMAAMLTNFGYSPGDIDFIWYLRLLKSGQS